MKIKKIISQTRRDFHAIYECKHCCHTVEDTGYDDSNFHENIIPAMKCKKCNKIADNNYKPLATKYPDGLIV